MMQNLILILLLLATGGPTADPTAEPLHLEALLEKTLFRVDVIALDLWLGPATSGEVRRLCAASDPADTPGDSLAGAVAASRDARSRMVLRRDVGLDRFLDGVIGDMRRARQAGLLDEEGFRVVSTGLPLWLAPLREEGLREGDRLLHRIAGDTLQTVVQRRDGAVVLDQTDVGAEHRRALLGSLVAPGGGFTDQLLDHLQQQVGAP
jgi:hypothetical protein